MAAAPATDMGDGTEDSELEALRRRVAALERDRAELAEALSDADARFHSAVERSLDGVIVLGSDGVVRFANASAAEVFGRAAEDLVGVEFGFPVVAGERTEIDIHRPGGSSVVAEMRATPTTWDHDDDAVLVLVRDITAVREAEARERELFREQTARKEAEANAERAAILDRAGRLVSSTLDIDELLVGLAELLVDEVGSACLIDIDDGSAPFRRLVVARRHNDRPVVFRPIPSDGVRLDMTHARARGFETTRTEVLPAERVHAVEDAHGEDRVRIFTRLDPSSALMVSIEADGRPWGTVVVVAAEEDGDLDDAALRLVEELMRRTCMAVENARLYRLARESSRAKSDFLAVVSHELRTPLSAAIGYAGLMLENIGGALSDQHEGYVHSIRKSAEHLERLIDQIITFARLEGGHERVEVVEVDPRLVVEDCATLIRPMAERRGLALEIDACEGLTVRTDERKLAQVMLNLASNAVKYTREGRVSLGCTVQGDDLVFRVSDSGSGIAPEHLDEIFQPFRQLDDPHTRAEGGAGIGLSVARNLTQLLGGTIDVESVPGEGSTFTVRLPRSGPTREDAAEAGTPDASASPVTPS